MKPFFLLLALLTGGAARADVPNPNLLPFGEEEAFLGNAGIAHTDSTGSTYYNPGALGFVRSRRISVYGNAYQGNHLYIQSEAQINGFGIPLNSSTFNPVPLSSVSIFGNERFTYAFSVHVPDSESFSFQMPLRENNTSLSLIGNASLSSLWIGPSVGHAVSDTFAWGASLYAIRYTESSVLMDNANVTTANQAVVGTVGSSSDLTDWSLLAILGAQWVLSPEWRVGARLETQTLDLRGRANTFNVVSGTLNGQSFNSLTNESGYYAQHRLPFQLGVGMETTSLPGVKLLFDLNTQFPVDYQTAPSRPTLSNRVLTHFEAHGNLGAKWRLSGHHSLLTGLMYNPSALPTGTSTFGNFSQEDFKGVTAGLQYDGGVLTTGLGGFFLWAKGQFQIPSSTQVSPLEHELYGLLITASYKL